MKHGDNKRAQTKAKIDAQKVAYKTVNSIAESLFSGNMASAFRYWSLACLIADQVPDEDTIFEYAVLDGSKDSGIDAYWIDDINNTLILLQSKYSDDSHSPIDRKVVQEFRSAAENLIDMQYIKRYSNRVIREAYPEIQEKLLDDNYSLWLILATNTVVRDSARHYADNQGSKPWTFEYSGQEYKKDVRMQIFELADLEKYRDSASALMVPSPTVDLSVPNNMYHDIPGDFKACQCTVLAKDIAEAYRTYRGAIFNLNLRGPLGSNKVNSAIVKSIESDVNRKNFHILNNGLSILCESFVYNPKTCKVNIVNFQVVNGCQTTYTLYDERDKLTDEVWVKASIIEGLNWARLIAISTNTQSAVKSEEFYTLEQVHQTIKSKLDALKEPWLYEIKRGEYRLSSASEQKRKKAKYGNRKINIREIGQSVLAFSGNPILAKFDLGILFNPLDKEGNRLYKQVFDESISAEQLLLPIIVTRKVKDKVRSIINSSNNIENSKPLSDADWLPYARMQLVGLVGQQIRVLDAGMTKNEEVYLPPLISKSCVESIESSFDKYFDRAFEAIKFRIEVFQEASSGPLTNLREYFRSDDNYNKMVERLNTQLPRKT